VQIIGASVDSAEANRKFAEKHGLRFPLLCDTEHEIAVAFGVARPLVGTARRSTFLLDADGTIRREWRAVTAAGHAAEVLAAARELWS
jgi:thioredoxin-dependent peroxiredoxin